MLFWTFPSPHGNSITVIKVYQDKEPSLVLIRYANNDYEKEGYDFSCISALYYQAFEKSYNELIWIGYAKLLNGLVIKGTKFTDILFYNKDSTITDPAAKGYLDDESKNRSFYVQYDNWSRTASVNSHCMYKSFGIIMASIKQGSNLDKFCEYFAKLAGFKGSSEMLQNKQFISNCHEFSSKVKQITDNRNSASHGGSLISLAQCTEDRMIILNSLETVSNNSIGLIQQLLYLLNKD